MAAGTIGRRIREARETLKLSVFDLAGKVSSSSTAISNWESDHLSPSPDNIQALSKSLQVTESYLLRGFDEAAENVDAILLKAAQQIAALLGIATERVSVRVTFVADSSTLPALSRFGEDPH